MSTLIESLESEINQLFIDTHYHLMDINYSVLKRFTQVRVFLDRDDGYGQTVKVKSKKCLDT